ncbi:hypothetical protein CBR_g177 [Chara braunii]|uniref:Uncharacterized protein n=1 Tax=Chara braunii TaxID=69332 RepID=A0A388JLU7_CHABU|nr:hypothetical protein CBR_g177 [Chara braunii]|eukprot:GBG58777.1 hypothetical protein CBR_g177 [Chara braunii]
MEWSSVHIDELMSKYGPDEQSSGHGGSCGEGSDATVTPKSRGGRPRSDALKWRDGKPGYLDNGPMFERLSVRDQMAIWDAKARPDVVFIEPVKLLQILGMFKQTCPRHGKDVEVTIKKIHYPCHICKLQFECGKGCTWHRSSAKVVSPGGVRNSRVETQLFHATLTAGMTYTQLNNLLRGLGMRKVRKETFYNFFRDDGPGSRQWLRHVERVTKKSFDKVIARLRRSNDPVLVLVDGHYDSSRDAQHCAVTAVDLKSGMIVGTETMLRENESSWKLETQCVVKLLHRLKDENNLIIAEVVHDDCGAVDVILRRMNINSQKCMWHKAKTLVKRLREAVRGTKTVKPAAVGTCEHVREVEWVSTRKKDKLVEIVWGVLFPDEAGKALPDDVVEIDALQTLHCNAAEEAKEWLYGACSLRERAKDDDGDVFATHVQHLADHWVGDHSCCDKELSNLCKAAGGPDRDPLYEAGGRVHFAVARRLQQFASNTKMAYYTRARMTFNNECFHSVINKYATKRLNFPKSYEARVCWTALEWNKNKRIRRLRTVFRKPTSVTHRRRSARQHIYATRDTSWRFDIATAVFGSPRVGDWARNMLQQSDVDDPVIEHYDEEADYGLSDVVESAVEGVVAEGDDVYIEAGSENASDDEKSSSDSVGVAHRLDFDGAVLSQEVSVAQERIFTSGVCPVLWKHRAAGASSAPACVISCGSVQQQAHLRLRRAWSPAAGLSSGRVFSGCGRCYAVEAEQFSEMDVRGCGHGLREEEIDAVAMVVTAVVVNTMNDMSLSSRDMVMQLRKRRALLQSVAEAPDCVATCEAVVQLCVALSSGVFPLQTPRWWIRRWTGGTWEDLRMCDDEADEYYRQKLHISMAMFTQIVTACATYVEKKVTHYRMPLPVEQVIAFAATGLQAVHDVTSALLQAYPNAIKWLVGCRRAQILRSFREKGFPNCFGAIDCTHIYIDKPAGAPSANYYDRKQKFSMQAQVVVDMDLRILDVHIGYPRSVHGGRVLHNSQLWRRAETGELFDAPPENLSHGVVTRGYLLGDNGYPVACPWIVQPYGGIDQGPDEERFDTRQKVAWGCVKRAFGRLKCMWGLFLRTHKTNLETLPQQFVAVCTLHNILLDAGIDFDENLLWEVDANGVRHTVDLGIVGNGAGGRRWSTNVDGDLLWDAL